jgi:hypothetical protein
MPTSTPTAHKIGSGYTVELKCKTDGHGGYSTATGKNVASKATPNTETEARRSVEKIDGRTGQTHVEYLKSGGETG